MGEFNGKILITAIGIIVFVAAVVLSGIAVVNTYRATLVVRATATNETGLSPSSGVVTLDNNEVKTLTYFGNITHSTDEGGIVIGRDVNWTGDGVITLNPINFSDTGTYNASYTYDQNTAGSDAADSFITGLSIFGGLIALLAITLIGSQVVKLFKN